MSPDSGYMENSIIEGTQGLFVSIAAEMIAPRLFKSLERSDLRKVIHKRRSILNNLSDDPRLSPAKKIRASLNLDQMTRRNYLNTKTNYKNLVRGARGIALGYAALTAAQLMEGIITPGLSRSAEISNSNQVGPEMMDSSIAYTQRQRALMAIHDSQLTTRGVIGQEAGYFHK